MSGVLEIMYGSGLRLWRGLIAEASGIECAAVVGWLFDGDEVKCALRRVRVQRRRKRLGKLGMLEDKQVRPGRPRRQTNVPGVTYVRGNGRITAGGVPCTEDREDRDLRRRKIGDGEQDEQYVLPLFLHSVRKLQDSGKEATAFVDFNTARRRDVSDLTRSIRCQVASTFNPFPVGSPAPGSRTRMASFGNLDLSRPLHRLHTFSVS